MASDAELVEVGCDAPAAGIEPILFEIGATGTGPMCDIEIGVDGSKRAEQAMGSPTPIRQGRRWRCGALRAFSRCR